MKAIDYIHDLEYSADGRALSHSVQCQWCGLLSGDYGINGIEWLRVRGEKLTGQLFH